MFIVHGGFTLQLVRSRVVSCRYNFIKTIETDIDQVHFNKKCWRYIFTMLPTEVV